MSAPVSCFGGKQLGAHDVAGELEERQFGAKSESKAPDPTGLGEIKAFRIGCPEVMWFTSRRQLGCGDPPGSWST